jgi:hypothetical protein
MRPRPPASSRKFLDTALHTSPAPLRLNILLDFYYWRDDVWRPTEALVQLLKGGNQSIRDMGFSRCINFNIGRLFPHCAKQEKRGNMAFSDSKIKVNLSKCVEKCCVAKSMKPAHAHWVVVGRNAAGPKNKGCRVPLRLSGQFSEKTIGGDARYFECARRFQRLQINCQSMNLTFRFRRY